MIRLTEFDRRPALYNTESGECAFLPEHYCLQETEQGIGEVLDESYQPVELLWMPLYAVLGTSNGPN